MIDDLPALRAFVLAVDGGSFTSAARVLGLSTNAVSQRIASLEKRLGARLLQRTTRKMSVTDEGRRAYLRVSAVLEELDRVEEELRPRQDELVGTVRVAMPAPAATPELLSGLGQVLGRHSQLRIQLLVTHAPVDVVASGIDLAIHVGEPRDSSLVARKLGDPSWLLAASPAYLERKGHPKKPKDLEAHDCLRFLADRPQTEWRLVDRNGRETVVAVGGNFESDDSRVLGDAVYLGLGIGIRAGLELEKAVAESRLERVLPGYHFAAAPVYALFPPGRLRVARVVAVFELLKSVVQKVL